MKQRPKTTYGGFSPSPATYDIKSLTRTGRPLTVSHSIGERPKTTSINFINLP